MGDDGGDLFLGHAVGLGILQVEFQGRIRHAGGHQGHHGEDAAGLDVDAVVVSVLAEENIIVVMRKGRSKCAKSIPASGLYDLFHKSKTSCCSCPGGAGHWITASV